MVAVAVATHGPNQLGRVFSPFYSKAVRSAANHLAFQSGSQLAIRIDEPQRNMGERLGGKCRLEKAAGEADISQPPNGGDHTGMRTCVYRKIHLIASAAPMFHAPARVSTELEIADRARS